MSNRPTGCSFVLDDVGWSIICQPMRFRSKFMATIPGAVAWYVWVDLRYRMPGRNLRTYRAASSMYGWTDRRLRGSRRLLINVSERPWFEFYWSFWRLYKSSNGVESERKESGSNRRRNRNVDGISFGRHSGAMKRIFESEVIYRLITDQLFQAERDGRSRLCARACPDRFISNIYREVRNEAIPSRHRR